MTALSAMVALVICLCLIPSTANAESEPIAPAISMEELESVLNGNAEVDGSIGPDLYDIDQNGIVEYDDLIVLKYLLGEGEPLTDALFSGTGEDLLSQSDISALQSAIVRGDSVRALRLNAEEAAAAVSVIFDTEQDFSQSVYLSMDTLCLADISNLTVTIQTSTGAMAPIIVRPLQAGWSTISISLANLSAEELQCVTGLTFQVGKGYDLVMDNLCLEGTAQHVNVTFNEDVGEAVYAAGYPYGNLPIPSKSGYVFNGWYSNEDCTGDRVTADTAVPEDAHTLYADWLLSRDITIDFSTTARRESLSSTEQVWAKGGVIFTNTKTSGSTNIADNSNPIRLYKSSSVKIEGVQIGKIVFTSQGAKDYEDALIATLDSLRVSYTVSDTSYTVAFETPVDVFEIPALAGQIRLYSITVSAVDDGTLPNIPVFDVSFNMNYEGAADTPAAKQVEEGDAYGQLPEVTREGYIFGGWHDNADCTGEPVSASTIVLNSHTLYAKWTAVVTPDATEDITIDFSTTDQRLSQTDSQQEWANSNLTFTNNKAASTNTVGNYSNPVRLYAKSSVSIAYSTGITKVVFFANTTGYAEALAGSIDANADVDIAIEGKTVSVVFASPVTEFSINKLTAQVRLDSIMATVVCTEDEPTDTTPETTEPEPTEPEPTDPPIEVETAEYTITFDNTSKRTEFSTTKQVWTENGITVTNNKASSTTSVGDYSNPVRFYKNSEIIIASKGMTKIVITASSNSYANTLASALSTTASGSTVTISFDTPVDSYTIIPSTGAVWLKSITVTAQVPNEPEDPDLPVEPDPETTFEVSFDLNYAGATGTPEARTIAAGEGYGDLPLVQRESYTFNGWYLDDEGTGDPVTAQTVVSASHTLYANWTAIPTSEPEPDDTVFVETEFELSFADKANRTSFSTEQQVWEQNGIVLINSKGSSTSNVADYAKPARFYKSSTVRIDCSSMKMIVFVANTTAYASDLQSSITGSTVSGKNVTVTFADPVNYFEFTLTGGQVRMDSLTVTALVPGESGSSGEDAGTDDTQTPDDDDAVTGGHIEPASVVYSYGAPESTDYTNVIKNWGIRGDVATSLSPNALAFYTAKNTSYSLLSAKKGASDLSLVPQSDLYVALKTLMVDAHVRQTTYGDVRYLMGYTDCENGNSDTFSLLYCGETISSAWDGGKAWNREHCWPKSKTTGSTGTANVDADIMTLRPATPSNNGSRSDKAYGTSTTTSYFNPNQFAGTKYDVRGDVARTVLYTYVRWEESALTGTGGVIESVEVLLDWVEADPVDTWELGRNDSVESITGTRNVFVDYPELAFLLFGEEVPANMQTPSNAA